MYFIIGIILGLLISHYFIVPKFFPNGDTHDTGNAITVISQFTCMVTTAFGLGYGLAKIVDGTHPVVNLFF